MREREKYRMVECRVRDLHTAHTHTHSHPPTQHTLTHTLEACLLMQTNIGLLAVCSIGYQSRTQSTDTAKVPLPYLPPSPCTSPTLCLLCVKMVCTMCWLSLRYDTYNTPHHTTTAVGAGVACMRRMEGIFT